ncbi:hypothetical protein HMPREF2690_00955 [Corynebacterium sp. HMSC034E11]|nr:hypothetical protein HMPREF2690_00955 [Corynebacterium sp. HMSC034E11]
MLSRVVVVKISTKCPENMGTPSMGNTKYSTAMCHKNTEYDQWPSVRMLFDDNTVPSNLCPSAKGATSRAANTAPSTTRTLNSSGLGCSRPRGPITPATHATGSANTTNGQRGPA